MWMFHVFMSNIQVTVINVRHWWKAQRIFRYPLLLFPSFYPSCFPVPSRDPQSSHRQTGLRERKRDKQSRTEPASCLSDFKAQEGDCSLFMACKLPQIRPEGPGGAERNTAGQLGQEGGGGRGVFHQEGSEVLIKPEKKSHPPTSIIFYSPFCRRR